MQPPPAPATFWAVRRFGNSARVVFAALVLATAACRSAEDVAHDALRVRLKQEGRLTQSELTQLFDAVGPAIAGKKPKMHHGAIARELTADEQAQLLQTFTDPTAVYDVGMRSEAGETWRGITGDATPPLAEISAMQTVWI